MVEWDSCPRQLCHQHTTLAPGLPCSLGLLLITSNYMSDEPVIHIVSVWELENLHMSQLTELYFDTNHTGLHAICSSTSPYGWGWDDVICQVGEQRRLRAPWPKCQTG